MTQRPAAVLAAISILAAAPGCGDDDGVPSDGDEGPLISYTRSGGIAGVHEELMIKPDASGTATVEIAGDSRQEAVQLKQDQLDRLVALLEATPIDSLPEPDPNSGCADCFQHELRYGGETYLATDVTLPAEIRPLLAVLDDVLAPVREP